MAYIKSETLSLAPTTSGVITYNTTGIFNGYLHAIQYSPTTSSLPSTGGNMLITADRTGLTLFNRDDLSTAFTGLYFPRFATVTSTGATSTGADRHSLFNERITVAITSGSTGGAKAATIRFFVE